MTRRKFHLDRTPIDFNIDDILKRLQERTIVNDRTGCWRYRSQNNFGYGILKIKGKYYYVHRLSAHIFLGLDLNDRNRHALHKSECLYKNCWNWNHLYVGDNCDNMNDLKLRRQLYATQLKTKQSSTQQSTTTKQRTQTNGRN